MYKKFSKNLSNTYDDISRIAFGTTDKAGGISKLNNNIEEGEVLVCFEEENMQNPYPKRISLQIGNKNYIDFSEYSLIDILGGVRGAVFIFNLSNKNYNIKIGEDAVVFDETGVFLVGRVTNIKREFNSKEKWAQVEIKSNAGVLLESVTPYPLQFENLSIENILKTIASYYNQKITFSEEAELNEVFVNEIGTTFSADTSESAYDFMNRICSSRGLLLNDTGQSLFVGRFSDKIKEKLNLIENEALGVSGMNIMFLGDGLARYYEINSQYPTTQTAIIQIPYPVPVTKRFNSDDYNSSDLSTIITRCACRDISSHIKINVVLNENKEIQSGDFVTIKNSDIGIDKETDFIVEMVERRHPNLTHLTLTLPCGYTFKIPEALPFC